MQEEILAGRRRAKCWRLRFFHDLPALEQPHRPLAGSFLALGVRGAFLGFWFLTIVLGGLFFVWHRAGMAPADYEHGLTISTNLFGTTYYSLVGLHAFHVTVGLIMLGIVFLFGLAGRVGTEPNRGVEVLSMYLHLWM